MFDFGIVDVVYRGRVKTLGNHYDDDVWEVVVRGVLHYWRATLPPVGTEDPVWYACGKVVEWRIK